MQRQTEAEEYEMADIRHRVGIRAPREQVAARLRTIAGLATWWTPDVRGDAERGGKLEFFFGGPDPSAVMEVVEAGAARVVWHCIEGPDEWVGGVLTFDLEATPDETVLKFTHSWREPVDFMFHCSTKWAYFLLGLKASLEGGRATPFPGDLKISSWG
jgi:uncharacterized protein YndB with AHSA1/START domain